jgi:hypothetical protein
MLKTNIINVAILLFTLSFSQMCIANETLTISVAAPADPVIFIKTEN